MDELFLNEPYLGSRQMQKRLRRLGYEIGRHRVRRLMRLMGLAAVYQRPRTSVAHQQHPVYPYLLRGFAITRPNQVWCADITYIPMQRGCWRDNIMVERLWRTLKYENIYLHAYETGSEVRSGIGAWLHKYNMR